MPDKNKQLNNTSVTRDNPSYARASRVDFSEIPVIDLAGLDDPQKQDALAKEIVSTASASGFFYVANHGIAQSLCDKAMGASRQFFDLTQDAKATIAVNQHQRGWMAQGLATLEGSATHDAKEVFFWGPDVGADNPDVLAQKALMHPNQWPDAAAPFLRKDVLPYYQAVMDLGMRILSCIAAELGATPDLIAQAYERPLGRGQLVYYPAISDADIAATRFGSAPHTDFGVLTILMQDTIGGLQVQNPAGDWIEAPPIPETFICNIGDLLERWTNGKLVSTPHRVLNRSGKTRYSIPIFCDPASDAVVDPRDFDPDAQVTNLPPIEAGMYIAAKNRLNFAHYDREEK